MPQLVYGTPREKIEYSIVNALQDLFHELDEKKTAVDTLNLTKSFGWTEIDYYRGQDLHEFINIFYEAIRNPLLKNTTTDIQLSDMLIGTLQQFTRCIDVEYETTREEKMFIQSLTLYKNEETLDECLDSFFSIERLEGDNKYRIPNGEKHEADMGLRSAKYPPVLLMELKRYEFDFNTMSINKVTRPVTYPAHLDLSKRSNNADDKYTLVAVAIHRGSREAGHNMVYIRPYSNFKKWILCNDSEVTEKSEQDALSEINDAILFVYVRSSVCAKFLDMLPPSQHFKTLLGNMTPFDLSFNFTG
jgi:ubiquitin carboxyl-terminal hydrolase 7